MSNGAWSKWFCMWKLQCEEEGKLAFTRWLMMYVKALCMKPPVQMRQIEGQLGQNIENGYPHWEMYNFTCCTPVVVCNSTFPVSPTLYVRFCYITLNGFEQQKHQASLMTYRNVPKDSEFISIINVSLVMNTSFCLWYHVVAQHQHDT